MKRNNTIFTYVKKYMYYVITGIVIFILFSPQELWDSMFGRFRFDHLFFVFMTFLLILVFISNVVEGKRILPKWIRENVWLMLYVVALILSVVTSTDIKMSLILLPRCLSGIFVVYIIYSCEFTYKNFSRIFGIVTLGLAITAVYAIMQAIVGVEPNKSFTDLTTNTNMPGRVHSFFDNPNVYGFALASLLPITLAYACAGKTHFRKILGAISFILGAVALILTYSRGAWFGFVGGMLVFVAICKPKLLPIILILGMVSIPFIPTSIKDRMLSIFNPSDTSISYRGLLAGSGLKLIADRPILGAGLGLDTVKEFVLENYWPKDIAYRFPHSHNLFIQVWCEMGILGFITFFGAISHNIVRATQSFKCKNINIRIFISALISGILALVLCGIADYPISYSRIMMLFWILFGLLSSARKIEEDTL